jgi:hypothetical protein
MIMSTKTLAADASFVPVADGRRNPRELIVDILGAIRAGIQAAHQYEHLTARGVAPAAAVRAVFDEHFAGR